MFGSAGGVKRRKRKRRWSWLISMNHLDPEALAKVRKKALEMDGRAYERSEVYRETPQAQHTLRVGQ